MNKRHRLWARELPAKDLLVEFMERQNRPMRLEPILKTGGLPRHARKNLLRELEDLARENLLVNLPGGEWAIPKILKRMDGVFRLLPSGGGIVSGEKSGGRDKEIFIPPGHTAGAWSKDLVRIVLKPGGRLGKVVEILDRRQKTLAAIVVKIEGRNVLCKPAGEGAAAKFSAEARPGMDKKIKPGDLLILRPEKEIASDLWKAEIREILGAENTVAAQEALVKAEHGVPGEFPALALRQAAAFPQSLGQADMAGREDLRQAPFVTIDGPDARDFDDAILVEKRGDAWLLRVAIADVSHYVEPSRTPGSLDAEARARGNSWYFPRSVEPMLPSALSNGLCSLRPNEDRLAILAEMPFARNGTPGKARFFPAIIRSSGRLTYDQTQAFFDELNGQNNEIKGKFFEDARIAPMLAAALELYKILASRRAARGSLDFDIPEAEYVFDAKNRLANIRASQRNDSHMLIEEFMIAANEAVAEFLGGRAIPFLFRVHPAPEESKLAALYASLKSAGLEKLPANLETGGMPNPAALREVLACVRGTPREYAVNRMCLRAMQQACYQPVNEGHFGLASSAYCHFTSPIRRYADLLVHRALKAALAGHGHLPDREKLWEIGVALNTLERRAMDCEREMARRMGCLLLRERVGEVMRGVVSGLTNFGAFVEFESMPVEGLILLRDMGDDWFELDERGQRLVGERSGISLALGQPISARILEVNLERMEIRLAPAKPLLPEKGGKNGGRSRKSASPGRGEKRVKNNEGRGGRVHKQEKSARKTTVRGKGKAGRSGPPEK